MAASPSAPLARALYRSLLEIARDYRKAGLPLVGVNRAAAAGFSWAGGAAETANQGGLWGKDRLRTLFKSGWRPETTAESVAFDDGLLALRALRQQLKVLRGADEEATLALRQWSSLLDNTRNSLHIIPDACAHGRLNVVASAIEEAAFELSVKTAPFVPQLLFSADDEDYEEIEIEAKTAKAKEMLDALALEVRDSAPAVFGEAAGVSASRIDQVHAMNEVLFRRHKYKSPPIEWVYDGFRPLLLSDVVLRRSGIPMSIAILYQSVARRLHLPVSLCQATDTGPSSGMGALSSSLPPDPDKWLLLVSPGPATASDAPPFLVDPSRSGEIMSVDDSRKRYPQMEVPIDDGADLSGLVKICASLTRTVVVAHQRRGESEAVASWLYQLLALSPDAQEWGDRKSVV